MNINLTTRCNLKCPYCFATDLWECAGSGPDDKEISMENLAVAIDFLKRSKVKTFRMFGGEPTLHSRFEDVYNTVTGHGFLVEIYTNGVIAREKVDFLSRQRNVKNIIINAQEPGFYSDGEHASFLYTLSRLGGLANVSFVVHTVDFDAHFLIDLIERYGLKRFIKVSIATACYKNGNVSIGINDHATVIQRLVEQSRRFAGHDLMWFPDTTFMWCLFTKEQLEELDRNVNFKPGNLCIPVLEVTPNLSVFRCYGTASLSDPGMKITDFTDVWDAFWYFSKKEQHFKRAGIFKGCVTCASNGRECSSGCLVHILKSFPGRKWGYIYPKKERKEEMVGVKEGGAI
jgi:hypothetical protein